MTIVKYKENTELKAENIMLQIVSLDKLAEAQGVNPLFDITTFFGIWPGEPDDGFEEMIRNNRQNDISQNNT